VCRKIFASVDGCRAEGLPCADTGAGTPIGASGNFSSFSLNYFVQEGLSMCLASEEGSVRIIVFGIETVYPSFFELVNFACLVG
jgi:hypothetical protein